MATTAVLEYLHKETDYHWSCGAKFGADFLLYDGPRSQRHAFAGLRIMVLPPPPTEEEAATTTAARGTGNDPPEDSMWTGAAAAAAGMPSAYELAAYVRCLNTAGKLALLATVAVVVTDKNHDNDQAAGERGDGSTSENHPPPHHEVTPTTTTILVKVAFVDVALEKILTAPTHQKYGRSEKRRDVAKNLAKTK